MNDSWGNTWNDEMEEYEGKFVHQTDNALLFLPEDREEGEQIWLPKSQIEYDDRDYEKDEPISIEIPNWLAEDKELI